MSSNHVVSPLPYGALFTLAVLALHAAVKGVAGAEMVFSLKSLLTPVGGHQGLDFHPILDIEGSFSREDFNRLNGTRFTECADGIGILLARGFLVREGDNVRLQNSCNFPVDTRTNEVEPDPVREEFSKHFTLAKSTIDPDYIQFVEALFKMMSDEPSSVMHAAIGMAGEGGEVLDAAKRRWIYNKPWDAVMDKTTGQTLQGNMLEEMGDMLFYFVKMMSLFNWTLEDIVNANRAKLSKRYADLKYSDAAANGRADKQATPPSTTLLPPATTGLPSDFAVQHIK